MARVARGFIKRRSLCWPSSTPARASPGAAETQPALRWLEDDPDATILRKDCVNAFVGAIEAVHHGMHGTSRNRVWTGSTRTGSSVLVTGLGTDTCVMDFVLTMLSARNHGLMPTLQDIVVLEPATATCPRGAGTGPAGAHPKGDAPHGALPHGLARRLLAGEFADGFWLG